MIYGNRPRGSHSCAAALAIAAVLIAVVTFIALLEGRTAPAGHLNVSVVDAFTLAPIEGAYVVAAGTGAGAKTSPDGRALLLNIPAAPDASISSLPGVDWGETTLLVYSEGYAPCAILHVRVNAYSVRQGPTVYMLKDDGTLDGPVSFIESPDGEWVKRLLDEYAP